jgi:Fe2+ or Zn2+ uptake regulation protein
MQFMTEIKLTSARKAILEVLEESPKHKTAIQIHKDLIDRLPSLNLSTVYRSLDYLVEHKLVSVSDIGTGSPVYERISDRPHHHLICLNCGILFNIDHHLVEPFFEMLNEEFNFRVQTNHLVLYGICEGCQSK